MQEIVKELAARAEREERDKINDQLIKMHASLFSSAMAYTNLIAAAGYAAMFTIWNFMRDDLTPWTRNVVALLLVISIGFFIAFEIYKMISNAVGAFSLNRLIRPNMALAEMQRVLGNQSKKEQRRMVALMIIWTPILAITIATAFAAGALLVWNFVKNLTQG